MAQRGKITETTKEMVDEWIQRVQESDDDAAKTELVLHYAGLVEALARKYSKGKVAYHNDLVQVGYLGLLGAISRFDATFDRKFESFAIPTIIGEIKRYLRDKTWSVHVPRRIKELGPKIKNTVEELTTELQRSPSIIEIAQTIGCEEEEVLEAMEMTQSYQALSVDHTFETDNDGSQMSLLDVVGNEDEGYELVEERMILAKVMPVLNEREQMVIQLTFFDNLSQKETGEKMQVSQMHVSRLQRGAIKKLRTALLELNEHDQT
ncbi:RNA polymerase sigma factor SigB [Brochothrix campestris]|uniref:RNA polymerase sigma factor n=1 Tax=Brochothrix campestris FSL F6-1037 TaxID=1265861 RepID=W7CWL1_9LIST|nr:RNA polymerase sigma factor SigB [Brochothrix campestris]EUJ40166.1 RNA polymerase sigma factor SigB [Brochothrix campestris FSL F6-1037]